MNRNLLIPIALSLLTWGLVAVLVWGIWEMLL